MKSISILITFIALAVPSFTNTPDKKVDTEQRFELMLGEFTLEELKDTSNKSWYERGYQRYKPKPKLVKDIAALEDLDDMTFSIYLGTWCPDSHREFPYLIKIFDQANISHDKLKLVGVTQRKQIPGLSKEERKELNIINVPTIIVYKNGEEMNRFVEYPVESLEEDMYKIMSDQPYKHSYDF